MRRIWRARTTFTGRLLALKKSLPHVKALGWAYPPFEIPAQIRAEWDARREGERMQRKWEQRFEAYAGEYPVLLQSSAVAWLAIFRQTSREGQCLDDRCSSGDRSDRDTQGFTNAPSKPSHPCCRNFSGVRRI